MKKSLFLIFMLCLTTAVQSKKEKDPIPNNGLVMYFDPFTNSKTGPMYERVTRKSIQTYDPATHHSMQVRHQLPQRAQAI